MEQEIEEEVSIGVGRIVHFVIERSYAEDPRIFEAPDVFCRPGIVVRSWAMQHGVDGAVNMVVFLDGSNDGVLAKDSHTHFLGGDAAATLAPNISLLSRWQTSVPPNHAVKTPGQWHWPRECARMSWAESAMHVYPGQEKPTKIYHLHVRGLTDPDHCMACKVSIPQE